MQQDNDRDIERLSLAILGLASPDEVSRFQSELHSNPHLGRYATRLNAHGRRYEVIKRCFDVLVSLLLLILMSPVMLLVAIGLAISLRRYPIHTEQRVGKNRKLFRQYTFQCMYPESRWEEQLRSRLTRDTDANAPSLQMPNDPRFSALGRFVRRFKLNRLPMLWNVISGKMSLIGPLAYFNDVAMTLESSYPQYAARLYTLPGITGLNAVLSEPRDTRWERMCDVDLFYVSQANFKIDVMICAAVCLRILGIGKETSLRACGLPTLDQIPSYSPSADLLSVQTEPLSEQELHAQFKSVFSRLANQIMADA